MILKLLRRVRYVLEEVVVIGLPDAGRTPFCTGTEGSAQCVEVDELVGLKGKERVNLISLYW